MYFFWGFFFGVLIMHDYSRGIIYNSLFILHTFVGIKREKQKKSKEIGNVSLLTYTQREK